MFRNIRLHSAMRDRATSGADVADPLLDKAHETLECRGQHAPVVERVLDAERSVPKQILGKECGIGVLPMLIRELQIRQMQYLQEGPGVRYIERIEESRMSMLEPIGKISVPK